MSSRHRHKDIYSEDSSSREARRSGKGRQESGGRSYGKNYTGRDRSRTPTRHRSRSPGRSHRISPTRKEHSRSPGHKPRIHKNRSPSSSDGSNSGDSSSTCTEEGSSRIVSFKAKDVAVPGDYVLLEESRERCKLSEAELERFKGYAKGTVSEPKERDKWIATLPVVDDVSGTPPHLQRNLRHGGDMRYNLSEGQAIDLHSSLYASLNLMAISDAEGVKEEDRANFRARAMRVISMMIQQVSHIRRVMAIDSLKLDKKVISTFGGRALDLKEAENPSREGQKVHWLFTKDMEEDLNAELKKKEKEADKKKSSTKSQPARRQSYQKERRYDEKLKDDGNKRKRGAESRGGGGNNYHKRARKN